MSNLSSLLFVVDYVSQAHVPIGLTTRIQFFSIVFLDKILELNILIRCEVRPIGFARAQ